MTTLDKYEIYTDGSHKGRWGSWAFVVLQDGKILSENFGKERKTNSLRMEFQAALEAIRSISKPSEISLHSDSRILIEIMTKKINLFKNPDPIKPLRVTIPHLDQILLLDQLCQNHQVNWNWIKAHKGHVYNERCDALCAAARVK
jgi:ribonuclease HI